MGKQIADNFANLFFEAAGLSATSFSNLIRFVAIMSVILAIIWTINTFLSDEAKESINLVYMGSRIVRLAVALTLFILFLTT